MELLIWQVCSLELAEKLKELEVGQFKSLWCWYNKRLHRKIGEFNCRGEIENSTYAAFTVAELGEMLPAEPPATSSKVKYPGIPEWKCWYYDTRIKAECYVTRGDTEVEVRAKMLIYLIENKLMEIPN